MPTDFEQAQNHPERLTEGAMLYKFAAGTVVSSCLIAVGGAVILAVRLVYGVRFYQMTALWCLVPFIWGVWMMLAPESWIAKRLAWWGAILGALAGISGMYVLDLPQRIVNIYIPAALKPMGIFVAAAVYAVLWIVVGKVYCALSAAPPTSRARSAAA